MDKKEIEHQGQEGKKDLKTVGEDDPELQAGDQRGVVLMRDGICVHPQPTSDPLDPLNWSTWRKNCILGIVMALYFMFTYITTTTVASFPHLQEQYGLSVSEVNWTVAIPALGLSVGPLLVSSLADSYGRRVVFIAGTVVALAATIGAAKAPSYQG